MMSVQKPKRARWQPNPWNNRNKFGARKYVSPLLNRQFDSTGEGKYAEHLFARERNGEISDLSFQVRVDLSINGVRIGQRYMRLDFKYFDKRLGEWVWDDFKGRMMPEWAMKRDIWAAGAGPGILRITKANRNRSIPYTHTDIRPVGCKEQRDE